MILVGHGCFLSWLLRCSKEMLACMIFNLCVSLLNRLYNPRSIDSKEKGHLPPTVIVSIFIGGINIDKSEPCNPRIFHLEDM